MDILSVQSRVVWGYVGNAVAVPVIQALGSHAWAIDTVRLAHHPGHGKPWGTRTSAADLRGLLAGALDKLNGAAAMLMGYLGSAEQGRIAMTLRDGARTAGRDLPLYLDPAFGDDAEGIYVDPEIVTFFRDDAVPAATVVMPNRFELAQLSSLAVDNPNDAVHAARVLLAQGPELVLVSSVPAPDGQIGNVLVSAEGAWMAPVPRLRLRAKGTGDMLSAAFTALHSNGESPVNALEHAVSIVNHAAEAAVERNLAELDIPGVLSEMGRPMGLVSGEIVAQALANSAPNT